MAPKRSLAVRHGTLVPFTVLARPSQDVPYGRVSSEKQRDDQTIDIQKNLLIGDIIARDRDDLPDAERRKLVAEFWDDGVTGTLPLEKRPEGRKLVNLICQRGSMRCQGDCNTAAVVDRVWITKLDRLARKLLILIEIEAFFRKHNVALRCLEFNIDTSDRNGKLMFHILGVIAEWERETILDRTAGGRQTTAQEGKTVGGRPTFGLQTDGDGHFVVDSTLINVAESVCEKGVMQAVDIVKAIFDNVALHGSTAHAEAHRFSMSERKVTYILHNPRYKGEGGMFTGGRQSGKPKVWISAGQGSTPQVVSPEIWDLAQTRLTDNRAQSVRNRHYDYLLSRLLVCCEPFTHVPVYHADGAKLGRNPKIPGICGRIFCGRVEHRKTRSHVYYNCTRQNYGKDECTARPLRGRQVEDAIWEIVAYAQRRPDEFIASTLREIDQVQVVRNLRLEITGLVEELSRLEGERQVVNRQERKGRLTEDEADAQVAQIDADMESLHVQKKALEVQFHSLTLSTNDLKRAGITSADIEEQIDNIEALCASPKPSEVKIGRQRKAALIRATVERIEVRTRPEGGHHLKAFLKFGGELPLDLLASEEGKDKPQPIVIVRELVLPFLDGRRRTS